MIALNGVRLTFKTFPNGETLVDGGEIKGLARENNLLDFKYGNDGDLIKLMFVKKHLDEMRSKVSLLIRYMPYSRMDRTEGDSVFTLKHTASFLNGLGFEEITVVEPHSDVTTALLDRSKAEYPTSLLLARVMEETGFDASRDFLFFPDAGAQKRYSKVKGFKQLVGFKSRDFETGEIRSLELVGNIDATEFKAIIVDDLCSYGGTFLRSAERLREAGASEVYLLVGHCEDAVFKGDMLGSGLVDKVFTTDTILDAAQGTERIRITEIGGILS
ncbi:ribose-phosphate pyrophosphokinase [Paenibacillus sp. PAMC21692]|uniref:ribose-phosphate pyrophosphokinase n=1 Tax=Paenibacillus sp. PAMC21692 TaxID=2762320 RepID=UPI00164DC13E|nr:ribose-phosphate pyrophosphokinase [Paenibacillus sp. PAMC21692]QNK57452.1 ribose-phosphate pyrophosphokinase [Paenibacillus sp. PAMC21692]